jgi:hypothetical protein
VLEDKVAHARFGQSDHIRLFGSADINLHIGSIVQMPPSYSLYEYAPKEIIDECNIPEECRTGFTGHSIFTLSKNDYLLSGLGLSIIDEWLYARRRASERLTNGAQPNT